jgi:GNAT superfamily N-acetyltransferase
MPRIESAAAPRDWTLREYSPGDREGVFQLRTEVYGETFSEEDWVWKFERSPLRPARIYLAESEGRIVGLRNFLFREVKVGNDVWLSVLTVDAMVHPDFRRLGIWSTLTREGVRRLRAEGIHLAVSFVGPHRNTYAGFRKLGWMDVGSIPLLVKPLRLGGLLAKALRSRRLQAPADRISAFLPGIRPRRRLPQAGGLSIERIESFDGQFDRLWEQQSRERTFSLVRDQKYLNYRYRDRPGESYALFAAYRGRNLSGYTVVRRSLRMFDLSIGLVMELATTGEPQEADSLVGEAVRYLDAEEVDAIGCLMMRHSPQYGVLRRAGFLPVPSRFNPRDYHPMVEADPTKLSRAMMADRGNWHFTWGDFDVG